MHFKCHFCWAIRVWREWPLHSAQIVLRHGTPCIYYCLVWWSVGGTMRVHHLWEGLLWPRHTIKARWCKLFAAEMLCEKQGILFIEMHYTRVPFNTHMQKCGLRGLWREENKGDEITHPKCGALPFPLLPRSAWAMLSIWAWEQHLLIHPCYKLNSFQRV